MMGSGAGELLKAKAEAGVRVLLMLWDDKTSLNTPYLRNGLMGVHDEARARTPAPLPLQPLHSAAYFNPNPKTRNLKFYWRRACTCC